MISSGHPTSRRDWLLQLSAASLGGGFLCHSGFQDCFGESSPTTGTAEKATSKEATNSKIIGLYVEDGQFKRNGKKIRGIGVNYFDCFTRLLDSDSSVVEMAFMRCESNFAKLQEWGIPFIRFNAGGFYPINWKLYQSNRETYFQRWERFLNLAETYEIGLIPSLFWTFFTQPGLAREPLSSWGNPESRTIAQVREYVSEVVTRSNHSNALWAWEFGNEYNLEIDLPNRKELLKHWYHPSLGMPAEPSNEDYLTTSHVQLALNEFSKSIRLLDDSRAILAGHASPRSAAWNLRNNSSWSSDSQSEWRDALKDQNPTSQSALSLHLYPFHGDGSGFAQGPTVPTLEIANSLSRETGQPLWIGEFGHSPKASIEGRIEQTKSIVELLERFNIQLSAAWVFDYEPQPSHNLATQENRPIMELLAEANRSWSVKDV